jgi:indolepyruvate ferredoxin oxidoreductase alpha subunit
MTFNDLIDPSPKKAFLLANEAIARAAIEKDVKVVAFYPGSPTSEILDTMYILASHFDDLKMEVASNEMVALETVAGASMAGVRGFTSMKSVGLNVAADSFFSLGYTGVNAGLVLLIADDPHAHSSQSEQDGRFFGEAAHVPMLEPSSAQEAYDMVKWAFDLSEKYKMLVLIRTTTRVNHQSGIVQLDELKRKPFKRNDWKEVQGKYYTLSATARRLKGEALEKLKKVEEEFETNPFNKLTLGEGDVGIITSGVSYLHVLEAVDILNINPHILKLGTTHPLPKEMIANFLKKVNKVIIVEELMPYLELRVTAIAKDAKPSVEIYGKYTKNFDYVGEYTVQSVVKGISSVLGLVTPVNYDFYLERAEKLKSILPKRIPTFCPGCPHRSTLWAVQQAINELDHVVNNDIGCYSMLLLEPYEITDSLLCMGASLGVSSGMQHVLNDKIISFVGDSTFFHAAMPGFVNAVHNKHNITVFILDNAVTAMTGQQPNPGSDFGVLPVVEIDIKAIVKAIGVEHITMINAFDPKNNVDKIKEALEFEGVSVVISKGPCALYNDRLKRKRGVPIIPNMVDKEECKTIYACIRDFYCPAIEMDMESRQAVILKDLCDGCMVCAKLCPVSSIKTTGGVQ